MGADFTAQLGAPTGGIMGPTPQAVAGNAPTPEMLNVARGQDPMANGLGSIRPSIAGTANRPPGGPMGSKGQRRPGSPAPGGMSNIPQPGPGQLDTGTPVPGGANPLLSIAQALRNRQPPGMPGMTPGNVV